MKVEKEIPLNLVIELFLTEIWQNLIKIQKIKKNQKKKPQKLWFYLCHSDQKSIID